MQAAMDLPNNADNAGVTPVSMKRDEFNLTCVLLSQAA